MNQRIKITDLRDTQAGYLCQIVGSAVVTICGACTGDFYWGEPKSNPESSGSRI